MPTYPFRYPYTYPHIHAFQTSDGSRPDTSFCLSNTVTWWSNKACMLKGSQSLREKTGDELLSLCETLPDFNCFNFDSSLSSLFKRFANCPLHVAFFSVRKTSLESAASGCAFGLCLFVFTNCTFSVFPDEFSLILGNLTEAVFSSFSS